MHSDAVHGRLILRRRKHLNLQLSARYASRKSHAQLEHALHCPLKVTNQPWRVMSLKSDERCYMRSVMSIHTKVSDDTFPLCVTYYVHTHKISRIDEPKE